MACHGDPAKSRGNNLYPLEAMSHISRALYAERRPVGNFIAFLFYAPFYGKVGAPLSTALPHLWWELGKKYGAVRASRRTTCSALAVIGYIFIIIYSNRKRYLGMGGETRIRSRSSVVGMMMMGDASFCVCVGLHVLASSSLRTVRDIHIQNHRVLTSFPRGDACACLLVSADITFKTSSCSPTLPPTSRVVAGHNRTCACAL